jgi:hypothetical protein
LDVDRAVEHASPLVLRSRAEVQLPAFTPWQSASPGPAATPGFSFEPPVAAG